VFVLENKMLQESKKWLFKLIAIEKVTQWRLGAIFVLVEDE